MTIKYQADAPVNKQYQLIKLAWNHSQRAPEDLEPSLLEELNQQADVALRLMTAVLGSPEAKKLEIKEQEIDFVFEQLKDQFDNEESFDLSLEQQQLSLEALKQAIFQELLCEKTIDSQSQGYQQATEQEALTYYQKNKERFKHPERRKVSHLLITIDNESTENRRDTAERRIEGIRKQLLNDIGKFSEMAAKYSECPTSLNEGVVGTVSRGQLYPELDLVLFNIMPNRISSIVESELGFHLLLCHEVYPAGETPQSEAIKEITKQINQHRKKKCEKKWLSSLLAAA